MENREVKRVDRDNMFVVVYEGKPSGGYRQLLAQAFRDNVFYGELGAYVQTTDIQAHVDIVTDALIEQLFHEATS